MTKDWYVTDVGRLDHFVTLQVMLDPGQKIRVNMLFHPDLDVNDAFAHYVPSALFIVVLFCQEINM